jgi:nucleoid DNA-binding protein
MKRIMKKPELVDELSARTGFYKKNMKEVVEALADIVIEHMQTATFEEDSEFHIAPGVLICGKRKAQQESIDPRDRSAVTTPEKVVPYAVFKPSVRLKLYKKPKGYKKKAKKV